MFLVNAMSSNKRRWVFYLSAILSAVMGLFLLPETTKWEVVLGLIRSHPFYVQYLYAGLQNALILGIPGVLLLFSRQQKEPYLQMLRPQGSYETGLTALSAVAYTMVGVLLMALWLNVLEGLGHTVHMDQLLTPSTPWQFLTALTMTALLPAIGEELIFRGLLLEGLKKRMNEKFAVVFSALLFTVAHFNLEGIVTILIIGLYLGQLRVKKNSLYLTMVFHFVYNASAILINAKGANPPPMVFPVCGFVFVLAAKTLLKPVQPTKRGEE